MTHLEKRLSGYTLTTADILYRMPDHPDLIQEFVWQDLDLAPSFPVLNKFLEFWRTEIEGPLVKVTVASSQLLKPQEFTWADADLRLH